jgi:hypothetical protein
MNKTTRRDLLKTGAFAGAANLSIPTAPAAAPVSESCGSHWNRPPKTAW